MWVKEHRESADRSEGKRVWSRGLDFCKAVPEVSCGILVGKLAGVSCWRKGSSSGLKCSRPAPRGDLH